MLTPLLRYVDLNMLLIHSHLSVLCLFDIRNEILTYVSILNTKTLGHIFHNLLYNNTLPVFKLTERGALVNLQLQSQLLVYPAAAELVCSFDGPGQSQRRASLHFPPLLGQPTFFNCKFYCLCAKKAPLSIRAFSPWRPDFSAVPTKKPL